MDKKEKNFATYKEFGKMLRAVASIYAKYGNTPLTDYLDIKSEIDFVTNKCDYDNFILPWMQMFMEHSFDVTEAKRWGDYVADCHAKGIKCDYQEYLKQNTK